MGEKLQESEGRIGELNLEMEEVVAMQEWAIFFLDFFFGADEDRFWGQFKEWSVGVSK